MTNPLTIKELNHVALYVRDLNASIEFYGQVLELPSLPRPAFNFNGAWFAFGRQELHLIEDAQNDRERHSVHFALLVDDAVAAHAKLAAKGVKTLRPPKTRPDGAAQVFLQDPDGYLLEITSLPPSPK